MKFNRPSQLLLVSMIGLLAATLLTACQIVTIDYLFVATAGTSGSGTGQIETFAVDAGSGAIRTIVPAVSSEGATPVSMVVTSDYLNLYVANQGNNSVVHFSIADSGVLTKKDSVTLAFTPVSIAVNSTGTFLYATGGTNPSELAVYPLSSGTIGTLAASVSLALRAPNAADLLVPTGVWVLENGSDVYVTAYDRSAYNPGGSTTSTANPGWVFGFAAGSGGALTATAGSPYQAGVKPSALTADPTDRFAYVTDFASNDLIGYTIQSTGALSFMVNGPFKTGNEPVALQIEPRGLYIYVVNALQNGLTSYSIVQATGAASASSSSTGGNPTDTQPVALVVDPALGRYVYTANYLGNSVSGFKLDPDSGALTPTQATPYVTGQNPSALAAVPHGNHAIQVVAP
jgi:6-phosphogluconolactonase